LQAALKSGVDARCCDCNRLDWCGNAGTSCGPCLQTRRKYERLRQVQPRSSRRNLRRFFVASAHFRIRAYCNSPLCAL